jgi:Leucine-rich repeat (LRR) protein
MSEKRSLTLPVLRKCAGFNVKKIKKEIVLDDQQLTDLDAFKQLPKQAKAAVEMLSANGNSIGDVEGVLSLSQLKVLKLNHNQIRSIKGFERLTNLYRVELAHNDLTNVSFLQSKLHFLDLSDNKNITLPRVLLGNVHLRELKLAGCGLMNQPVSFCPMKNLRSLDVSRNELLSLDFLIGLNQLEELSFRQNHIRQIASVLPQLKALKKVDTRENPITDFAQLQLPKEVHVLKTKEKNKKQKKTEKAKEEEGEGEGEEKEEAEKAKEKKEKPKKEKIAKKKKKTKTASDVSESSKKRAKVSTAEDVVQQALQGAALDGWD